MYNVFFFTNILYILSYKLILKKQNKNSLLFLFNLPLKNRPVNFFEKKIKKWTNH